MPVIGLTFKSIQAKREKGMIKSEIKINSTPKIIGVKEMDIQALNKKALAMEFEFLTLYNPTIAEIKISGELLYTTKENKVVLDSWQKNKKLPENVSVEVLNHLFRRCLIKVSNLADDLQLPPPIPMPRVGTKSEQSYIG